MKIINKAQDINTQYSQGNQQISGKLGEKSVSTTAPSAEAIHLARNHDPISATHKKDLKILYNESQFNKEKDTRGFSFGLLEKGNNNFEQSVTRNITHHQSKELKNIVQQIKIVQKTPSEANLFKLESALKIWQENNPKEVEDRGSRIQELQYEIKGLVQKIQANRAEDAGVLNLSVDPNKAELFHSGSVTFDHLGRVQGLGQISQAKLDILKNSATTPLTELNSMAERTAPKTESESIIEFAFKFSQSSSTEAKELANEAKSLWMGGVNKNSLLNLLEKAKSKLSSDDPLQNLVSKQISDAKKEKHTNQYMDAIFNRRFDSEIAHEMVKSPSKGALDNAKKIGEYLLNDFTARMENKDKSSVDRTLRSFARTINSDVRPWFSQVPEVTTYIDSPTMENFEKMMSHVDDGFGVIKMPFLAVKMHTDANMGFDVKSYKLEGDRFYGRPITKARSPSGQTPAETPQTKHYGTGLAYQPKGTVYDNFISGRSVPDSKAIRVDELSQHDKNAIENGVAVVTGASGSTNILTHMAKYLAEINDDFSTEQSQLNTLAFLTFDGGHSLNESMSVYKALQVEGDDRETILNNYHINYEDIVSLAKHDDKTAIRDLLDKAYASTLQFYGQNAYSSTNNNQKIMG
ncbi:hypothetical protein [Vibrio sp. AND4]|uniref:hypothetical protein n=1 Tax=Vibrio sp. AND4 TaxID=314289 RepID=UPI00015F0EB7|nr:hypothetical protein [Vibrio sp. AND4]EDP58962.1 hypothetical protein AND4_03309 [Vibrio sp. AND4]